MAMPVLVPGVRPGEWTADLVRQLPEDGNRYEVIDGELLVSPSPSWSHQRIVGELYHQLRLMLDPLGVVDVLSSPADLELEPGAIVQPDVFIYPLRAGAAVSGWHELRTLLVAIEVLSPSTARTDRITKRRFFARRGVPEFWVIDPGSEVVEVSVPGISTIRVETEQLRWQPPGDTTAIAIDLPALFARGRAP
jgi:Uma2 family endonuclease